MLDARTDRREMARPLINRRSGDRRLHDVPVAEDRRVSERRLFDTHAAERVAEERRIRERRLHERRSRGEWDKLKQQCDVCEYYGKIRASNNEG